jgi:putative addiction module component (TIGR02574 family)
MSHEALELLKQALALPDKDRAELAGNLIESLDDGIDDDVETAWQEEVVRRAAELKSGKVRPIPWEDVQQKARRLLDGE